MPIRSEQDVNTSVKRSPGSTSFFQAEENGNSWSIFNVFRHFKVCIAQVTILLLADDVDVKKAT